MENNDSEVSLVLKSRQGDESAFKKLYDKHSQAVFQTAYRLTESRTSAEDITQEVFVAIYKSLNDFNFDAAFRTWCYRITVNKCLDLIRKQKRRQKYKKGTVSPEKFDRYLNADTGKQPDKKLNRKEISEIIQQRLQEMKEELRICFVLREFEQLPYKEITEIMQCSEGTVASRLARARSNIVDYL